MPVHVWFGQNVLLFSTPLFVNQSGNCRSVKAPLPLQMYNPHLKGFKLDRHTYKQKKASDKTLTTKI